MTKKEMNIRNKKWRDSLTPEQKQQWYQQQKECRKKKKAQYQETQRKWVIKNREKLNKYARKWRHKKEAQNGKKVL